MRALVSTAPGGPETLAIGELPDPEPGAGEVLLRVRACGVNYPDALTIRDLYQVKYPRPFAPGAEVCGVVERLGEGASGVAPGDLVVASCMTGGMAQRIAVPAAACTRVPPGTPPERAAGFMLTYSTAWHALRDRAALRAGETLLVHGATGGMGAAAVQLGAALGATVIATGTRDDWLERLRPLGAAHRLSSRGDFASQVRTLTGGRGADVIYDPVGGDVFDRSTKCIAFGGRLLVVGFAAGRIPTLAANHVLIKGYSVVGVRAGEWTRQRPAEAPAIRAAIARLAASGTFRPLVGATFPLERATEALAALAHREAPGKIVVEIDGA